MSKRMVLKISESVLFVLASLSLFYWFHIGISNVLGFPDFNRIIAPLIFFLLPVYLLFIVHKIIYPENTKKLRLTYMVNGIVLADLSLISVILSCVYLGVNVYHGLEGTLTPLFPIDIIVFSFLLFGLGIFFYFKGKKIDPSSSIEAYPFAHGKVRKVTTSIFRGLFVLISLYMFGAFLMNIVIGNYGSSRAGNMIPFWALVVIQVAILFYYEFIYKEKKMPGLKNFYVSAFALGLTLIFVITLLIVVLNDKYLIISEGSSLFPIDLQASLNLAPYLAALPPLLYLLPTCLFELFDKKKD